MRATRWLPVAVLAATLLDPARAEVAPTAISAPEAKAWTGQKLSLIVELRSRGSFAGSASFSIPQVPGSLIIKLDSVVVSSEQIEGEEWFVQTHEFALFSQRTGPLQIPEFPVRFGRRDGFDGPVEELETSIPSIGVEIERPPGSEGIAFLITTESLAVSESWDPQPNETPDPIEIGTIFKRRIVQQADGMTGMALIPAPLEAPDGIRVYPPKAETSDRTERGEFRGERRETLTYLMEKPGTLTLPEIRYTWWNPKQQQLETKTLPAIEIEVAAPPSSADSSGGRQLSPWWLAAATTLLLGLLWWWQRSRIARSGRALWQRWHPPARVAERQLIRACHRADPAAAWAAWFQWNLVSPAVPSLNETLESEITSLQRHLFGPDPGMQAWDATALARAFRDQLQLSHRDPLRSKRSVLPELN